MNEKLNEDIIFLKARDFFYKNFSEIDETMRLLLDDNLFEYSLVETNIYRQKKYPNVKEIDLWEIKSFLSM